MAPCVTIYFHFFALPIQIPIPFTTPSTFTMQPLANGAGGLCLSPGSNLLPHLCLIWVLPSLPGGGMQARVLLSFCLNVTPFFNAHALIFFSCAVSLAFDRIDIFNAYTKTWSVAALSQARIYPAGASLPEQGLVLFAGGSGTLLRTLLPRTSSVHAW